MIATTWFTFTVLGIAILMLISAILLRHHQKLSFWLAFSIAIVMLLYKTTEFSYYRVIQNGMYPVEFSHVSYFVVSATLISGVKKARFFGGFCAFASAIGYYVGAIFSPETTINTLTTWYIVVGIIQHNLLFFLGLVILFNLGLYEMKDIWITFLGVALMIIYSILVYEKVIYPDSTGRNSMIIIDILNGSILGYIMPIESVTLPLRIVTVVGLGVLLIVFILISIKLNQVSYYARAKYFVKKGIPLYNFDPGLIYPLKKWYRKHQIKIYGN